MWARRARTSHAAKCVDARRLLRQPGDGGPEDAGVPDGVEGQVVGGEEEVGRCRVAVEVEREVVRGEDLAEGDGRRRAGPVDDADELRVHAEPGALAADVAPERVVADLGDEGDGVPVTGGGHRDVGGAPAEELLEGAHVLEPDPVLEGVDVDTRPPHGDEVVARSRGPWSGVPGPELERAGRRRGCGRWRPARRPPGPRRSPPGRRSGWCPARGRTSRRSPLPRGRPTMAAMSTSPSAERHVHPAGDGARCRCPAPPGPRGRGRGGRP